MVAAIIGTGIDTSHPVFSGKTIIQKDFTGEGNGDRNGHGTAVASLMCGRPTDSVSIGVAPGVKTILVAKVFGTGGSGAADAMPAALDWIANYENDIVDIVVAALGISYTTLIIDRFTNSRESAAQDTSNIFPGFLQTIRTIEAIAVASRVSGNGISIITPGGNDSDGDQSRLSVESPISLARGVLSVGGVHQSGTGFSIADYSHNGVDLVAPSGKITVAALNNSTTEMSGTSMACGVTAGVCCLWWEYLRKMKTDINVHASDVNAAMLAAANSMILADLEPSLYGAGIVQVPDNA